MSTSTSGNAEAVASRLHPEDEDLQPMRAMIETTTGTRWEVDTPDEFGALETEVIAALWQRLREDGTLIVRPWQDRPLNASQNLNRCASIAPAQVVTIAAG